MPCFAVRCSLKDSENISTFRAYDPLNRFWGLILTCTACKESTPNFLTFNPNDEHENQGGVSNLFVKCKGCKHEMTVSFVKPSAKDLETRYVLTIGGSGGGSNSSSCVAAIFDCRGCEIEKVSAEGKWEATNTEHEKKWIVDWKEGGDEEEFAEYDEDIGGLATISGILLTVQRA